VNFRAVQGRPARANRPWSLRKAEKGWLARATPLQGDPFSAAGQKNPLLH
jgi:hypothetical protein